MDLLVVDRTEFDRYWVTTLCPHRLNLPNQRSGQTTSDIFTVFSFVDAKGTIEAFAMVIYSGVNIFICWTYQICFLFWFILFYLWLLFWYFLTSVRITYLLIIWKINQYYKIIIRLWNLMWQLILLYILTPI